MPRTTRLARPFPLSGTRPRALRLACEPLERRLLPTGGLPALLPPMPGFSPVAAFRQAVALCTSPVAAAAHGRVLCADFDGDGVLDRAELVETASGSVDQLFLAHGIGDGRFEPCERISLDDVANSLLTADLNSDGAIDLFVHGVSPEHATLLLNRGDGTFTAYHRDPDEAALAVADLTGDRRDDFVYAYQDGDRLSVQLADGRQQVLLTGYPGMLSPRTLTLADLSGDGLPDLVVADGSSRVLIFPGRGDGTFAPEIWDGSGLPTGRLPVQVTVARLGDVGEIDPESGKFFDPFPDLVVTNQGSDAVTIYYGGRDGLRYGGAVPTGTAPAATAGADVTGDGRPDLVVTCSGSDEVWVIPGAGDGRFADWAARVLPTGPHPNISYLSDFDGDKAVDLVTLNGKSDTLTYYPNVAAVTAASTLHTTGAVPVAGLVQDVNSDGMSDLLVGTTTGAVELYAGTAAGLQWQQTLTTSGGRLSALAPMATTTNANAFYALGTDTGQAALVTVDPGDSSSPPAAPSTATTTDGSNRPAGETLTVMLPMLVALLPLSTHPADVVPLLVPGPHDPMVNPISLRPAAGLAAGTGDGVAEILGRK
ncbi:MAG: VCBS repeat-containing protein [Gemmataceae bacterium]